MFEIYVLMIFIGMTTDLGIGVSSDFTWGQAPYIFVTSKNGYTVENGTKGVFTSMQHKYVSYHDIMSIPKGQITYSYNSVATQFARVDGTSYDFLNGWLSTRFVASVTATSGKYDELPSGTNTGLYKLIKVKREDKYGTDYILDAYLDTLWNSGIKRDTRNTETKQYPTSYFYS